MDLFYQVSKYLELNYHKLTGFCDIFCVCIKNSAKKNLLFLSHSPRYSLIQSLQTKLRTYLCFDKQQRAFCYQSMIFFMGIKLVQIINCCVRKRKLYAAPNSSICVCVCVPHTSSDK